MHVIFSGGSPSSIFATAKFLRWLGIVPSQIQTGEVGVVFTQAFQIGEGSAAWQAANTVRPEDEVTVIGVPVNNRDPQMTEDFFRHILTARPTLAVYDEHESERWETLRTTLNLPAECFHTPGRGDGHLSAASLVPGGKDELACVLWTQAGDWADNRDISVPDTAREIAIAVDTAVKTRIADNKFRETVVLSLLGDKQATEEFEARLKEGRAIEEATASCLAAAELRGNVLVVRQPQDVEINQTAAMFMGYSRAPFVAVVGRKSGEGKVVTVGTNRRDIDLLNQLRAAGFVVSGISQKATVTRVERLDAIVAELNKMSLPA